MKTKKLKKRKKYYSGKSRAKLSWPMSAKSDKKNILFKKKEKTKLPWPMTAKPDTQLPGFIYNEIRFFLDRL